MTKGQENAELRTELFCQIIKQLTGNPAGQAGERKGWELMALLLSSFPVPEHFENYLTVFLMDNAEARGQKFISIMHKTQYVEEERERGGEGGRGVLVPNHTTR
jgi:hypothetical protein